MPHYIKRQFLLTISLAMLSSACTTVVSISPAMDEVGVPAYWIEIVNGPRESALQKANKTGEALCKGQPFHIAREDERESASIYLLRALVKCAPASPRS